MATSYGFTLLGDLTGSTAARTVKSDPCAKTLAMMGEGTGSKSAAASTAKTVKDADVYFTNGNWITGKGCWHTDPHCPALKLANTGITSGNKTEAKDKGLAPCRRCPVRAAEKSLHDELSASIDSDGTDGLDCETATTTRLATSSLCVNCLS